MDDVIFSRKDWETFGKNGWKTDKDRKCKVTHDNLKDVGYKIKQEVTKSKPKL